MTLSILERVAGGDSAAVGECIHQYSGLVWSLARRLSRTPSDAEDATQDIFLQIWRQADRFDNTLGSEKTFIATIARRRLIDRLRKSTAEPIMDSSPEVLESISWSEPSNSSEHAIGIEQAMLALAELRPDHRRMLELGFLKGLTHPEIAKLMELPLGTVKSCMRRSLIRVRQFLNIDVDQAARGVVGVKTSSSAAIASTG